MMRIKRMIRSAIEELCEVLHHPGACSLLNFHGGRWSAIYRWTWEGEE